MRYSKSFSSLKFIVLFSSIDITTIQVAYRLHGKMMGGDEGNYTLLKTQTIGPIL